MPQTCTASSRSEKSASRCALLPPSTLHDSSAPPRNAAHSLSELTEHRPRRGDHDTPVYPSSSRIAIQGESADAFAVLADGETGQLPFTVRVIYEDDHIAAVHKPPGINTYCPPEAEGLERLRSMEFAVPYFLKQPSVRCPARCPLPVRRYCNECWTC